MPGRLRHQACIVCVALIASANSLVTRAAQTTALKIVVVEGEGAVNIIQQKTAVAPVIEVRDRNNQPVAGAIVRFAIQKGQASFNGARTLTVTTNAAGRAAASGFTPIGSGALRIGATAAFQGQTAAVSIAQTSVMTSAEAASLGSIPSAPVSGGGLSHLAVAAIAGGGAIGAVLAKNAIASGRTFSGPFEGQFVMTIGSCASTRSLRGTLTLELKEHGDGSVTGSGNGSGTQAEVSNSCGGNSGFGSASINGNASGTVSGTTQNISFHAQASFPMTGPGTFNDTSTLTFTGALSNGVISGALTYSEVATGQGPANSGSGTTTMPVTLR